MKQPVSTSAPVQSDDSDARESRINEIIIAVMIFLKEVAQSYQHSQGVIPEEHPQDQEEDQSGKPDFRREVHIIAGQIAEIGLTSREIVAVFRKALLKAEVTISGCDMLQILACAFEPELAETDEACLEEMFSTAT